MGYFAHKTAEVDKGAQIGKDTKIWHWSHISEGAIIGDNCVIGQNVYVANKVLLGKNVKVQNNVSVFENVVIEDDVFCGPSMVFTNVINPRSAIPRKNEFMETLVKRGATLGANCTILCGLEIGMYAFIGAGAVVTKNVKNYALMAGVPAIQIGWMSEFGERMEFKNTPDNIFICKHSGDEYFLEGDQCRKK